MYCCMKRQLGNVTWLENEQPMLCVYRPFPETAFGKVERILNSTYPGGSTYINVIHPQRFSQHWLHLFSPIYLRDVTWNKIPATAPGETQIQPQIEVKEKWRIFDENIEKFGIVVDAYRVPVTNVLRCWWYLFSLLLLRWSCGFIHLCTAAATAAYMCGSLYSALPLCPILR